MNRRVETRQLIIAAGTWHAIKHAVGAWANSVYFCVHTIDDEEDTVPTVKGNTLRITAIENKGVKMCNAIIACSIFAVIAWLNLIDLFPVVIRDEDMAVHRVVGHASRFIGKGCGRGRVEKIPGKGHLKQVIPGKDGHLIDFGVTEQQ